VRAAGIIVGNGVGKILGFARELVLAYFLGTTGTADAFRVSLTAALVPTHFFMGDVLDGAFIPLYSKRLLENRDSAARLARATMFYLLLASLIVVSLTTFASRVVVSLFAPGLSRESATLASKMLTWMGLGIPAYVLSNLGALRMLSAGRVAGVALRQPVINLGFIVAIPIAAWLGKPELTGVGFSVALLVYAIIIGRGLRKADRHLPPQTPGKVGMMGGEARELLRASSPLISMMVLGQLLALVDRVAASFLGTGAIASLEYARTFVEIPLVIIGAAVATVSLSRFAHLSPDEVQSTATRSLLPLITGALVALTILGTVAPEVVSVVLRRGHFDRAAVTTVSTAIRGLSIGAAFFMAAYIMHRILTAQMRAVEGIWPLAASLLTAAVANIILLPRLGLFGVALGLSLGQIVYCGLLARRLGLLSAFTNRLPTWTVGALLAIVLRAFVPLPEVVPFFRGAISAILSGFSMLLVLCLAATTRDDMIVLWRQVTRWASLVATRMSVPRKAVP